VITGHLNSLLRLSPEVCKIAAHQADFHVN